MNFGLQLESNARGWTSDIFKGFNRESNLADNRFYSMDYVTDFYDHFVSAGHYTLTQATQGTFAVDNTVPNLGVWLLDCNSSTSTQGANLQFITLPVQVTTSNVVAFEWRGKVADVATGPEAFLGLHTSDTTIIASSAMGASANSWAGFKTLTDNNVYLATTADNTTEETDTGATLVDDTYVRLGFRIERREFCDFYVNGVKVSRNTTNLPLASDVLFPSFVCQSAGTTDPIMHLDAMRVCVS